MERGKMKYKKTYGTIIFDALNVSILFILAAVTLYPYIYVVSSSISDPLLLYRGSKLIFLPKGLNMGGFRIVFRHPLILRAFLNSVLYVVLGTSLNLVMNSFAAFVLSKRYLPGSKLLMKMIVITMFFSGGMIPNFLLIYKLGWIDKIWAMIIPGALSAWNVILMRTYFLGIDPAMEESAKIDGANEFRILFNIILPVSVPVIAVVGLRYAVGHWNGFFNALLYLRTRSKFPLQLILREILIQNRRELTEGVFENPEAIAENVKYALIVVSTMPVIAVYPYLQKYLVKGIMIGSIK
jgi:putative aldouronate transport system permease protein